MADPRDLAVFLPPIRFWGGAWDQAQSLASAAAGRRARVAAESDASVPIEVEGEPVGTLPATFEVIPSCLRVIA
jgi:diacylglycerol kinase family enzyme